MKTWTMVLVGLLVAGLVAMGVSGQVAARGPRDGGSGTIASTGAGYRYGFVDADGDGINDRYGLTDGTPLADGTGAQFGFGYGFVDEDGDGINDRYGTCDGTPLNDGTRAGYGYGFVDEDGDGINDRYGTCDGTPLNDGTPRGQQAGRGRWNR